METEIVIEILAGLGKAILALIAFGIGTERGTELVKVFLRTVGSKVTWLDFSNARAFLLAAVVAGVASYVLGFDVTQYLTWLDGYDSAVVELVNAFLLMFVSNKIHDRFTSTPRHYDVVGSAVG